MKKHFSKQLWKAVREYYGWHGDKNAKPVKFVTDIKGREMLLVRFHDNTNGLDASSLMVVDAWKDGHYDVTEIFVFQRECEEANVKMYEQGGFDIWEDEEDDEDELS